MQRILVPTDFSPTAEKAFRFALDIATKATDAEEALSAETGG